MSKILGIACAFALATSASALANPAQSKVPYLHPAKEVITYIYQCHASSPTGSYGYSAWVSTLALAQSQALYQCAIRTPRGYACVITRCQ